MYDFSLIQGHIERFVQLPNGLIMEKIFLSLLLTIVAFSSCKEGKGVGIFSSGDEEEEDSIEAFAGDTLHLFEDEEPPEAVDELFDDFFFNFASDVRFQNQRIAFPLSCKDGEEVMKLSRDDWKQLNSFDSQDFFSVIYEREHDLELQKDTSVNSVSVEWVYLQEDYVERFNFKRVSGKWTLTDIEKDQFSCLPNGDFLDFYSQFIADSAYQRNALSQPLKLVLTPQSDDEEEQVEHLSVDDWFAMKSDLPFPEDMLVNIDYGQTCISQNRKTLLMEGVSNGLQMKFRFDKVGNGWKLIQIEY